MDLTRLLTDLIARAACGKDLLRLDGIPSEGELHLLCQYAKAQDLAHLLMAPLDELGLLLEGSELRLELEKQVYTAIYRSERLGYELAELSRVLEGAGILHIPLKGAVLRELYPELWMRTSTDIDVLVHAEDAERAAELLVSELGYQSPWLSERDIQLIAPSGLHLELHFKTIEERVLSDAHAVLSRIWEHASPDKGCNCRLVLDGAMLHFYLVAHAAKHLKYAGFGIRPFLDLWLLRRGAEIDGEVSLALLAEGHLTEFAAVAEHLAEVWFSGAEHTETTARLARYVLSGGIHGSRENMIALENVRHGRLGSSMRLIFLPYRQMKLKYPSLERHRLARLALPFYHLHRWFSLLFRRRVRSSIRILQDNGRIGAERGGEVKLLLQELHLDRA